MKLKKCCKNPKYTAWIEAFGIVRSSTRDDEAGWELNIDITDANLINLDCENCGAIIEFDHEFYVSHLNFKQGEEL